jgi:bifunctional DNA-binding transcriptional regulator/antitoxin component of YhaV-PrlF toxin-antitoxin module
MSEIMVKLGKGSRLVVPAGYRKAMGIAAGDTLILRFEAGILHIMTPRQAIKQAQDLVRGYVPKERSLVDEFIAERRQVAAHE